MESARDITILKDEKSEFPILCETCLGPNPLIRMMKQNMGKECKVCERPFTIFRWKPGPKSRYKQTIICQICAKIKNLCQTCLFDLQYGLPIQVRDKFMNNPIELPDSNKNLIYKLNNIQNTNEPQIDPHNEEILKKISRVAPYYRRNKPRLCTFWIRGICNRGEECPYSHEQDSFDPSLSKQNILGRYKGKNDPLALKILKQLQDDVLQQEKGNERDKEKESEKGSEMEYPSMNPTEAIKRLN